MQQFPSSERTPLSAFQRLLSLIPAAAYTCNADGLITYFNSVAAQVWGREPTLNDPAERYCGSFHLLSPSGSPIPHSERWMARCLQEGTQFLDRPIVVERTDGSRIRVHANAIPFLNDNLILTGAVNLLIETESSYGDTRPADSPHP